MIHNAGGRASDDAIRSLAQSHKLLGTKEWFVIHHFSPSVMQCSATNIGVVGGEPSRRSMFDKRSFGHKAVFEMLSKT